MTADRVAGVSFDLFGTLVTVDRPDDPAGAVAGALAARGVPVPNDWATAYGERHLDRPEGAAVPLPDHVAAALASRGADRVAVREDAERAVRAAFDPAVSTREDAPAAVAAVADRWPVGVLSNCSVPGLAERAIARSAVDGSALAVTTSVGCGWRKPHPRAFRSVARDIGVDVGALVHVGDDPVTDGGAGDAGAQAILTDEVPLADVPGALEERWG